MPGRPFEPGKIRYLHYYARAREAQAHKHCAEGSPGLSGVTGLLRGGKFWRQHSTTTHFPRINVHLCAFSLCTNQGNQ
jgi:hypothetical protein